MANLLDRIISQLDALVQYLSLAHREVFDLVSAEYESWCGNGSHVPFPNTFDAFQTHVAHSAFVLGYSYADAFLADLMREIYRKHRNMLPKNKKLSFEAIAETSDYNSVLEKMIDIEVYDAMHGSISDIEKYCKDRFSIAWPAVQSEQLAVASLIRNCIIHNNSVVDNRLAERSDWSVGATITVAVNDVHRYGVAIRSTVRHIYEEASRRHLGR